MDGALGVFVLGLLYGAVDAEPIAHEADFAEWNAGLGHPEGSGIHPEEEDFLFRLAKRGIRVFVLSSPPLTRLITQSDAWSGFSLFLAFDKRKFAA